MGYRLTQDAEHDIGSIAENGIEMFGIHQARAYHDALFDLFDLIASNPRMGRARTELARPMRVYPFRSHIVLYQIEGAEVLIIRICHAHEDWVNWQD